MEFEQPQDTSPIDDAVRVEAMTRQLSIAPLHDVVAADDITDEQLVSQHLHGPALANASIDSEQTVAVASPGTTQSPHGAHDAAHHNTALYVSLGVASLLIAALVFVISRG